MVKNTTGLDNLNIRLMTLEDVPQVFDLERMCFNDSSWTIDAFYHEVEKNKFARYFVMEYNQEIIGYIGMWVVIDQAQITTVAITETMRGYGLGKLIIEYAMSYARQTCDVMSLEVRIENRPARHVYEALGFNYGGKRKNYYGEGEDALVMWVDL
ncbi:ribosomal protein S18-alanine N-acetyltransferase [Staphylococcus sp. IVB6181]|uniref:ribosomal protein S18-alanine N-acetyltransferase n=1 Tax=Staphylococcus sp. IVB6181 TaxID=2929481 RepID=UPI0037DA0DB1